MLTRRTPLRPKREKPRRKAPERVPQGRMKPRAGEGPTPEQERFHDALRFDPRGRCRPCQCGCGKPGEHIHHILARAPGKVGRRDHWFVVWLTGGCHNLRSDSVHGLGSEAKFREVHGVDLVAVAVWNLDWWRARDV